jgi:GT2 family glycosyltransferase
VKDSTNTHLAASVVITTFDRPEMLADCVRDVSKQEGVEEIIVVDDSPAQTGRGALPLDAERVRYFPTAGRMGPSAARNLGARHARSENLVHFDDDCRIPEAGTVLRALHDLRPPNIAAVAMPYRNALISEEILCKAFSPDSIEKVYAFTACAYAIKKSLFEAAGGYREEFFYMGEESDLCIRLLDRAFSTRLGNGPVVDHLQPAGRISRAADFYGRRNDILFEFFNAPAAALPFALIRAAFKSVAYGVKVKRPMVMLQGTLSGLAGARKFRCRRAPVRMETYSEFKRAVGRHAS